jgi:hypothetical protein
MVVGEKMIFALGYELQLNMWQNLAAADVTEFNEIET